jgi:hypothetical protein
VVLDLSHWQGRTKLLPTDTLSVIVEGLDEDLPLLTLLARFLGPNEGRGIDKY